MLLEPSCALFPLAGWGRAVCGERGWLWEGPMEQTVLRAYVVLWRFDETYSDLLNAHAQAYTRVGCRKWTSVTYRPSSVKPWALKILLSHSEHQQSRL